MTNRPDLKEALSRRLLIGDGAMSTYLYQHGIPVGVCPEELTLTHPDWVTDVHRRYREAGASLIQTNTYGANRERLSRYGIESKTTRINREAAALAREGAGDGAYVLGTIGSILAGRVLHYSETDYRDMYEEQATALLYAGVDGIILETFIDLKELVLALETIRPLTKVPLLCNLALVEVGRTRDGHLLSEAFQVLKEKGADGVGLNCRLGPLEIERALKQTRVPEGVALAAYPNAGRLGLFNGEYRYKSTPEYFAERALSLREQGVTVIGGCCGTTPEHIGAIATAVEGLDPLPRINPDRPEGGEPQEDIRIQPRTRPSVVDQVKRETTVIIEFDSPKDLDISEYLRGAEELNRAGADAVTLADNSMATTRMSNMALGAIMKERTGAEPLVHITCRDRNLIGQQSHLMGLHALGIDQILVITGDPTRIGDLPGSSSIYDVTSFDLIRMVKQLNEGISFSGKPLKQKARFVVGAAFNPNVAKIEAAVRRLEKKVEAGADFIMTQPVYDTESLQRVAEATRHIPIPIFIGIMPLTGHRNALFLHHELPGVKIPDSVMQRMEGKKGEEGRHEGVAIARELLDEAVELFKGIYLITPFHYWEMTAELTRYIRQRTQTGIAAGS
ncbi:bifunctional homocysteine S-methyltransferase/methylenetetrahydrofolate reductase [Desmospora profundinema]|uniref:Homocysteine S-methyltransferase n=1 Tax=Desmospora profundinema TaxID=1571184 RepID=A0ABU1INI1_9BACL|nr:bifunctional homocysteine S-methyltransferase/methylenetetrahydrofolate reductase [Desmospora profundinema]MDR6225729.1 homocysteine S-methyltransferase [Desmospora profundinema]